MVKNVSVSRYCAFIIFILSLYQSESGSSISLPVSSVTPVASVLVPNETVLATAAHLAPVDSCLTFST